MFQNCLSTLSHYQKKNMWKQDLCLQKKHNCNLVATWEKTLWLDEAKIELFNQNSNQYVWCKSNTTHTSETQSLLWSMLVITSCCVAVFYQQGLGGLLKYKNEWVVWNTEPYCKRSAIRVWKTFAIFCKTIIVNVRLCKQALLFLNNDTQHSLTRMQSVPPFCQEWSKVIPQK